MLNSRHTLTPTHHKCSHRNALTPAAYRTGTLAQRHIVYLRHRGSASRPHRDIVKP
jgi:hypothetical protein